MVQSCLNNEKWSILVKNDYLNTKFNGMANIPGLTWFLFNIEKGIILILSSKVQNRYIPEPPDIVSTSVYSEE